MKITVIYHKLGNLPVFTKKCYQCLFFLLQIDGNFAVITVIFGVITNLEYTFSDLARLLLAERSF